MIDLNVSETYRDEPDEDFVLVKEHKRPRTGSQSILRTLAYRVDLRKLTPGQPNEHLKYLVGRVRLTKACHQSHWIEDFGGVDTSYLCTADGTYRVVFSCDEYYDGDTEGELVCGHHFADLANQEATYGNIISSVIVPSTGESVTTLKL